MKCLFQELCISKLGWDEPLSELFQRRWGDWLSELEATRSITILRCYKLNTSSKILSTELHGFSDASIKAFAAAIYVRFKTEFGYITSLVTSKTRVAPAKKQSLPRLELLGLLILARLIISVRTALQHVVQFNRLTCWSDSLVALYWISRDKEWKQFVKNRANEVRSLISPDSLRFCPGTDNPADIPTRGIAASGLENNGLWWNGPRWLTTGEENWPENVDLQKVPPEAMEELKSSDFTVINLSVTSDIKLETLIDSHRFSSFDKLLRITAWVKRFVYNCRSSKLKKSGNLTAQEIVDAEVWIREIQQRFSSMQLKQLEHSLGLFVDTKGIIRSRDRIAKTNLPYETKHPALLYSNHHVTELIVRNCHVRVKHNGVKETLAELRTRYWLIRGRQVVKRVIFSCVCCKKLEDKILVDTWKTSSQESHI